MKLGRRARGHFVTLIEMCAHLIRVKPGHISLICQTNVMISLIMFDQNVKIQLDERL